jgi:hypothetical protein
MAGPDVPQHIQGVLRVVPFERQAERVGLRESCEPRQAFGVPPAHLERVRHRDPDPFLLRGREVWLVAVHVASQVAIAHGGPTVPLEFP